MVRVVHSHPVEEDPVDDVERRMGCECLLEIIRRYLSRNLWNQYSVGARYAII
jgi:hypothetical protein